MLSNAGRLALLTSVLAISSLSASGRQDSTSRAPGLIPALDHVSPDIRTARHNIYAARQNAAPLSPNKPPPITTVDTVPLPELPVDISEVIVVGKVTRIDPWLTPDNSTIYSEYGIAVDSVLKNRSTWKQDATLDLLQIGGSAYIPNVGTVTNVVGGIGAQIETGRAYLLFLHYRPKAQCFTFVKAWDVTDGQALPVRNDDVGRVRQHLSSVYGLTLEALVVRIRVLVNANK